MALMSTVFFCLSSYFLFVILSDHIFLSSYCFFVDGSEVGNLFFG